MTPSREEALFALALEKLAEKRPASLDAVCEGDTALRARLEALLAAHEQPETLLATQAESARPTIKLDLADLSRSHRRESAPFSIANRKWISADSRQRLVF